VPVVFIDEALDGVAQLGDGAEHAMLEASSGALGEEAIDGIEPAADRLVLVGGIVTFAKMTRSRELVVARAAGVSVWQFILPVLVIAALLGGVFMTVVNPLASATTSRFEQMDATHLRGKSSLMELSKSGIWLRLKTAHFIAAGLRAA